MALKQNIIYIYFKGKHLVTSKSQYQYNHGQFLYFADLDLPQAFEVHFSNKDKGYSKPKVGSNKLVEIPDEYYWSGAQMIYAWIYLHSDIDDGETVYEVRIPLIKRAEPTDEQPLPQQESAMERAIAELNTAVEITTENANKTGEDRAQVSDIRDEVVDLKEDIDATAETVGQKAQDAIDASRRSEESAQNAAEFEEGARNYSEEAEQSAQSALESKNIAQQKSEVATNASNEALGYKNEALEAKNQAVQAKQNIVDYRDETKRYKDETKEYKNEALNAKNDIQSLKEQIESISDTVNDDAQSASQSASSASQSAESASQSEINASNSANDASQSANQAEQFKNQSETNVTHYPKIVDGYWLVWDATNEEWINTNIDASGEDGVSPIVTITDNVAQGTHFVKIVDKDGIKATTINDGITIVMNPSSFVIPTDENGILMNDVILTVKFKAYRGNTLLNIAVISGTPIQLDDPDNPMSLRIVSWSTTGSATEVSSNAKLLSGYKIHGRNNGVFGLTVSIDGKNIIMNPSWVIAKCGEKGDIGNGISNIVLNPDFTLTVTFTDGTSYTSPSIRGEKGQKGDKGDIGNGIASTILNNDYTLTVTFTDGTTYTTPSIRGQQGDKGDKGDVGESGVYIGADEPQDDGIKVWIDTDEAGTEADLIQDVVDLKEENKKIIDNLATDTASGAIASFSDGADDIPLKSLVIDINPVQDLHGQDAPYPAGGGVNKFDVSTELTGYKLGSGTGVLEQSANYCTSDFIPVSANTDYYFLNVARGVEAVCVGWYDSNKEFIATNTMGGGSDHKTSGIKTSPSNASYARIVHYVGIENVALNYPSTATAWSPYENICPISGWTEVNVNHSDADMTNPTTLTIQLGQTVYGGKLDVLSGELTIDRAMDTYNGGEAWSFTSSVTAYTDRVIRVSDSYPTGRGNLPIVANYLSSKIDNTEPWSGYVNNNGVLLVFFPKGTFANATEWKAYLAENPLSVIYPLATPIEIQLSANQLNSLYGVNNLWADSGDTEVEYRADTSLYVKRKITEAIAALS